MIEHIAKVSAGTNMELRPSNATQATAMEQTAIALIVVPVTTELAAARLARSAPRVARRVIAKEGAAAAEAGVTSEVTKRPSTFRKKTVQDAWDNAATGSQPGTKRCSTCPKDVKVAPGTGKRDWDVDHKRKWKNRDLKGMDRKQVLDEFNTDTRLRCHHCNRSDN